MIMLKNTELRQNILLWLLKIFRLILLSFHPYLEIYGIIPLEAGERLIISDPTEHPYIYFYIKPYQNMILIHIENNYDGVIKGSIDGDILSVKQGKEHGLGIRRVKELVEKADGVLQITSDNKIFPYIL